MATQSILVEDCSPMITYAPAESWQDAPPEDTLASSYSGGSYHRTDTPGATATFRFRGTGFQLTGGRRPGYGPFSVTLDGQRLFSGNPTSGPDPARNTLASVSGLSNDVHTVVFSNLGGGVVDIDAFTFETQIGSAGSTPQITNYDDNDSEITYLPSASAWNMNSRPEFHDNTLHFSQAPDAAASLKFTGNAIGVYGTVSPDHADFSVAIDGQTISMPRGSGHLSAAVRPNILLYWVDGLSDGEHTMMLSKTANPDAGPFVDLDYFAVYSSPQSSNIVTNPTSPGSGSQLPSNVGSSGNGNRTAIIVGASLAGAFVVVLMLIGMFFVLKRRKKQQETRTTMNVSISPVTPILPMQMMEAGINRKGPVSNGSREQSAFPFPPPAAEKRTTFWNKRSSKLSIAPSYYGEAVDAPTEPVPEVPRIGRPSESSPRRPLRPARRPPTLNMASLQ